jgi:hypothetical protein
MPYWIELMSNDSVEVPEQGIFNCEVVQVNLRTRDIRPTGPLYAFGTPYVCATPFELAQGRFHAFYHSSLDLLHHIRHWLIQLDNIRFPRLKRVLHFFMEPELRMVIQLRASTEQK